MNLEMIFFVAGLMALSLIILMVMFARLYRKAGPMKRSSFMDFVAPESSRAAVR